MEKSFTINLSSDTDGFLEYECPFCEQKFRLATNEFQGNGEYSELYCDKKEKKIFHFFSCVLLIGLQMSVDCIC